MKKSLADRVMEKVIFGIKRIEVVDQSKTYILCYNQDGKKVFIEESKLKNAEALGLSVGRV